MSETFSRQRVKEPVIDRRLETHVCQQPGPFLRFFLGISNGTIWRCHCNQRYQYYVSSAGYDGWRSMG